MHGRSRWRSWIAPRPAGVAAAAVTSVSGVCWGTIAGHVDLPFQYRRPGGTAIRPGRFLRRWGARLIEMAVPLADAGMVASRIGLRRWFLQTASPPTSGGDGFGLRRGSGQPALVQRAILADTDARLSADRDDAWTSAVL